MLFFIFVALLVVGLVWYLICDNGFALFLTIVGAFCVAVSIVGICATYITADAYVASNLARYDTLVYQWENNFYDNDNEIGKRELVKDIQNWNEDLTIYKVLQDDFWIGIYYPNVYDQFELIPLNLTNTNIDRKEN